MGIAEKFKGFCDDLAMNNRSVISDRYKAITKRLNKDFWGSESETLHSLYTGSYGRGTASAGCSDIDMIMELPWSEYTKYNAYKVNGQSALLQAVRASIRQTYPSTEVGADGQVVVVSFTDGVKFEVVPGFEFQDKSFYYPDSNDGGSWRTTNPRPEIKAIGDRDAECNGNLKNLAKMARAWRDTHGVYMGGLAVDTFCFRFIEDWAHRDKSYLYYDYMTRDFFKYLAGLDDDQGYWLAPGSGQHVTRKGKFKTKAKKAHELALEAIEHETSNREWSANQKWKEIYGYSF